MNSSHKPFLLQSRLLAYAFAPLGLRTLWVRGASRRFGSAQRPQFRYETVYEMSSRGV